MENDNCMLHFINNMSASTEQEKYTCAKKTITC